MKSEVSFTNLIKLVYLRKSIFLVALLIVFALGTIHYIEKEERYLLIAEFQKSTYLNGDTLMIVGSDRSHSVNEIIENETSSTNNSSQNFRYYEGKTNTGKKSKILYSIQTFSNSNELNKNFEIINRIFKRIVSLEEQELIVFREQLSKQYRSLFESYALDSLKSNCLLDIIRSKSLNIKHMRVCKKISNLHEKQKSIIELVSDHNFLEHAKNTILELNSVREDLHSSNRSLFFIHEEIDKLLFKFDSYVEVFKTLSNMSASVKKYKIITRPSASLDSRRIYGTKYFFILFLFSCNFSIFVVVLITFLLNIRKNSTIGFFS